MLEFPRMTTDRIVFRLQYYTYPIALRQSIPCSTTGILDARLWGMCSIRHSKDDPRTIDVTVSYEDTLTQSYGVSTCAEQYSRYDPRTIGVTVSY